MMGPVSHCSYSNACGAWSESLYTFCFARSQAQALKLSNTPASRMGNSSAQMEQPWKLCSPLGTPSTMSHLFFTKSG